MWIQHALECTHAVRLKHRGYSKGVQCQDTEARTWKSVRSRLKNSEPMTRPMKMSPKMCEAMNCLLRASSWNSRTSRICTHTHATSESSIHCRDTMYYGTHQSVTGALCASLKAEHSTTSVPPRQTNVHVPNNQHANERDRPESRKQDANKR